MTIEPDEDGITWVEITGAAPCPFCGDTGPLHCCDLMLDEAGTPLWVPVCASCQASGPPTLGGPAEALARWSIRGRPERVN